MSSDDRFSARFQRSLMERPYSLSETQPDPAFDRITRLASRALDVSVSVLCFADDRQVMIRSAHGTAAFACPRHTLPLDDALGQHVIGNADVFSVPDTSEPALTQYSKLVSAAELQSILCVPVRTSGDATVGMLCVGERVPREWTEHDTAVLEDFSALAADEFERRHPAATTNPEDSQSDQQRRDRERLLESIGEGVYTLDKEGICLFINRAGANMLGFEPEEIIGQQMHELVHYQYPDGRPMSRDECTIIRALRSGDAISISEQIWWRRDGNPIRVELTASPVADDGDITGTVVRFHDLSERQLQQERLRESEVRKTAMFEAALDCIITFDHEGMIVEFNSAAERTFGYSRENAMGRQLAELILPEEFGRDFFSNFADYFHAGSTRDPGNRSQQIAVRSDGVLIDTEMAVVRIDLPDQPHPIFTTYIRDITERKKAERELRIHKHMVDAVGQAVVGNDNSPERRITYWNRAAEQMFGWSTDEVLGKGLYDIVPAPDFKEDVAAIGKFVRQGRDWHGEFRIRHRDGRVIEALANVNPIIGDDGELLGVISAYTDLTKIKDTESEIRLYKHIVDGIGESVVASGMDRRIFYANKAAEQAFGWTIDDVYGKDIRDIVPAESDRDRSTWIGSEVRTRGEPVSGEFALRRTSGETFPALVTLAPMFGDNEELVGTIGIYTDVSDLKETEGEVRLYKHLTDAVGQALIATDFDRRITYINSAAEQKLGWTRDEVVGRDFRDVVPANEALNQFPEISSSVRAGKVWSGEYQLKRKDGSTFPVLMNVSPVFDDNGEIVQIIGAYTDISELKATEQDLLFHKHVVGTVEQPIIANDINGLVTYFNKAAEDLLGWKADEVMGRFWMEFGPAPDLGDEIPRISQHVRQGKPWFGESGLQRKDGSYVPVIKHISPVLDDDGNVVHIIGAYTDITGLRQREDEIRFFQHVVEALGEAVVATSLDGTITYLNSSAEQMLGWKEDEIIGRTLLETIPDQSRLEEAKHIAAHVRSGKSWLGEFALQRKDGSVFPAIISVAPVADEHGNPSGIISVYTDISDLKQAEEENRFFKNVVDAVGQVVVANDLNRNVTYWNQVAEEVLGWKAEEVLGTDAAGVVPYPEFLPTIPEITGIVRSGGTWVGEFPMKHRDGSIVPALSTLKPIRDENDEIIGVLGAHTDISVLKKTEEELRFHKHIVDAVGQAVIVSDRAGQITYWNKAAEDIYGWPAEDAVGARVFELLPVSSEIERSTSITRHVISGNHWSGEVFVQHKDGHQFPAFFTVSPIRGNEGDIVGLIGVSHDISKRKEYERQIEFHKHMLDAVGQAVCATDEELRVTYWNRAAEELYGFRPSEAIGTKLLDFLPPDSPGFQQAVEAVDSVARDGSWSGEMFTYHRDGTEIAALVSVSPILGEDDRQVGLIVAMADISARKKIEQALQESNEQITDILETMGDGFISLNRDWTISYVNRQAEHITGRSREQLVGSGFWEKFPEPEHQPFFLKFQEALETGKSVDVSDFDPYLGIWLEVHVSPSRDQLSVFFRDITERREREVALREAEERYRTLVEQHPAMTYIAQPDNLSKLIYVSPQVSSMLGYDSEAWLETPNFWLDLLHPEDRDQVIENDAKTMEQGHDQFVLEYRLRDIHGSYRWVRDSATLIRDIDGNPTYWQGLSYDVTEQKHSERMVRESEQRFRSLFDNHPDAVFSIDHSGAVLSANPAFEEMTGYSFETNEPMLFVDLVTEGDKERVRDRFAATHEGEPQDFRAGVLDPTGNRLELNLTTIPIIVEEDIVGVHVVAQDVTIHQQLENQLAHQAFHDSLTGLPNRNLFQNRLTERLDRARQDSDQFAVLFFDLDDFKVINDSLGHSAGDQLLVEVASRVQTCIRSNDLLSRLGGDEFTLLLEHVVDANDAIIIAERIAKVLDQQFDIDEHEVFITTSIGIALGDEDSTGSEDILRNADLAMYDAKNSGKNRYAIFEPSMNSRAWLRLTLDTEIRRGIPRDEFEVHYQPIVDLETGDLEGVEALVRWNHPERGLLTPSEFISVAEQSGLILPLGRWIIREASTQLRHWQQLMPAGKPLRLSLNLSPRQYQHPRLIEELTRTLESVDFDARLITLEITESIAMDDSPETIQTLQKLKDVGVQLALDDFGTGFSALSYLRRFPIDIIKIDQSFVDGLGIDPEDTSIVQAVMAASLAMKLRVTAEGVETIDQLNLLRDLGCHHGQGYLFSKALTANEMEQVITRHEYAWSSLFSGD